MSNFNHLQKLGPATFDLWTRILRHNPNSSLWLLKFPREAEAHLHRAAAAAGVAPRRILLTDKFPLEEHLRVKRAASLLLDTLEYNAHVSGLDALWAGLPLVTLAGRLGGWVQGVLPMQPALWLFCWLQLSRPTWSAQAATWLDGAGRLSCNPCDFPTSSRAHRFPSIPSARLV